MTLKIGDKIKSLRKQQNITQEKLAAYLNISYQAISKWENNTALPDITLVPQIANFFGVTADELLGMKEAEENKELNTYEEAYGENYRLGKIPDNIALSRKVIEKYPRNYEWMLNLAYSLTQYNDTKEHRKFSAEHNYIVEAITACERILEDCTTDSIRHGAIQLLCYLYPQTGKKDAALKLAYEMPEIWLSKELLLEHILEGEEKIKQCQQNLINMIDLSAGIILKLVSDAFMGKELTIYQKIHFLETADSLYKSVLPKDADRLFFNCRTCQIYEGLAELWCRLKDDKKAIEYLMLAEKAAAAYDSCNNSGEQSYESVFLNRCTFNPKSVSKNWEGSERHALFARTQENVFDDLRGFEDFIKLQKRLGTCS